MSEFRLLTEGDGHAAPVGAPCPECGKPISSSEQYSAAYLSGGAVLMREDGRVGHASERLRAFLSVGVLDDSVSAERTDVSVVENLQGGQFHLQWCSVVCMRGWMLRVLDEVERRLAEAKQAAQGT